MNREFSKREKIMLIAFAVILLIIGYFKLVLEPINNEVDILAENTLADQDELDTLQPQLIALQKMQAELETIKASGDYREIPDYDNAQKVMNDLHVILSGAVDYSLSFAGTTEADGIVRRPINMDFSTHDYETARAIIERLHDTGDFNQISEVSCSRVKNGDDLGFATKLTITYYEQNVSGTPTTAVAP